MKVFGWISLKDVKNIIFSVAVVFICLLNAEVYADKNVKMSAFDVSSGIKEIYRNGLSTKYKIVASYNIFKITDQNGGSSGITLERKSGNSALFSCNGLTKIRVYSTSSKYEEVNLENAIPDVTPPEILWKYKDASDNIVWFEVEDEAGLYEIRSTSSGQTLRTVFTKMQKSVVASVEASRIEDLVISDVFGNVGTIDVSNITLNVTKALKNVNGSRFIIRLNDYKNTITGIEYVDGRPIEVLSTNGFEDAFDVLPGTTKVKVKFGDEYAIVQLDTDAKSPEVIRAWRKNDSSRVLLETRDDQSGIRKISYYNRNTKYEELFKEFHNDEGGKVTPYDIEEGITHIYIYDGVDNITKLSVSSIDVDDEAPMINIKYVDGQYKIIVKENESGMSELKLNEDDITTYTDYPTGEFVYTYNDLEGGSYVTASDGVGNIMSLTVDEIISVRDRVYRNSRGDILSIKIEDDRGIQKITDQDGNVIERLLINETEINGVYKVRKNTDSINVFYGNNKSYNIKLQELSLKPQVSNEVYDNELITECLVASKAGIRKIEYNDGRKIVFKKDMPDDIVVNCTRIDNGVAVPTFVTVYDALGNSVNINESLGGI